MTQSEIYSKTDSTLSWVCPKKIANLSEKFITLYKRAHKSKNAQSNPFSSLRVILAPGTSPWFYGCCQGKGIDFSYFRSENVERGDWSGGMVSHLSSSPQIKKVQQQRDSVKSSGSTSFVPCFTMCWNIRLRLPIPVQKVRPGVRFVCFDRKKFYWNFHFTSWHNL